MESARIQHLWEQLYDGDPWTWIRLKDILKDVDAVQAACHPIPNANSIWQLVQHCSGWRRNVLRKMQGEAFRSPDDNYLSEPDNVSPQAWEQLLADFEQVDTDWRNFISTLSDEDLDRPYAPADGKYTWYAVIHGLMHHDNYHFGQIVILKKMLP